MMKRYFFVLVLLSFEVLAQKNLIVNGSFEQYSELPNSTSELYKCKGWFNPDKSARATPDYFRTDASGLAARLPRLSWNSESSVEPHTGRAAVGLFLCSIHEYVSTALSESMVVGKTYSLSFYATVGSGIPYGKKAVKIGAYFSEQTPNQEKEHFYAMEVEPQHQSPEFFSNKNWEKISFTFVADKAYRYLTIGSFDAKHQFRIMETGNNLDAYVFFDDVELIEQEPEVEFEIVENEPSAIVKVEAPAVPLMLEGRAVSVQTEEMVFSKKLEIEVYDHKSIDGDIISLNFNGEWVLREYTLKKKPFKLKLELNPNQPNYLILFAHNLGKVPPNTAYMNIKAGKFRKAVTLSSGMGKCGAITFKYLE
jgi:hypothetical protein